MNLFELFVKIGVDDQASKNLSNITTKLGNGLKTAAKVGTAAVTTAAAAITALTTAAVNNYAEYEQLVSGAELMFDGAFETVMQNAQNAYRTVQMSQNEYLRQVNGFATGLKTALGGNEQAAAALANRIIQAEADIVAATGNTQEAVQNAFNGIMRSNFTMLDNLQIGITPTKEGFQEVIDKVNEWNATMGNATNYQMGNLADMQSALVDYIDMQGLAGYAAVEASETISGSVASMKAAWSDLVTGIADENADIEELINNFVDSAGTVAENLIPRIEQVFINLKKVVKTGLDAAYNKFREFLDSLGVLDEFDTIVEKISSVFNTVSDIFNDVKSKAEEVFPKVKQTVTDAFDRIGTAIQPVIDFFKELIDATKDYFTSEESAEDITNALKDAVEFLGDGISKLSDFFATVIEKITDFVKWLSDGSTAADLLISLVTGLTAALVAHEVATKAVSAAMLILEGVQKAITIAQAALNAVMNANPFVLVATLIAGLVTAIITLWNTNEDFRNALISAWEAIKEAATTIFSAVANFFTETIPNAFNSVLDWFKNIGEKFSDIGNNIVSGIKNGISNAWNGLKEWFSGLWDGLVGGVKDFLGIHSPSRVFADIGANMALGVGEGWEDKFGKIKNDINDSLDFDDISVGIESSIHNANSDTNGLSALRGVQVIQNIYSQAQTAADLMEEALYEQERAVLMGV